MVKKPPYPASRVVEITETLHGQQIHDPYRWLEEDESPEVVAWTAAQNEYTEALLSGSAGEEPLRHGLEKAFEIGTLGTPIVAAGQAFWLERRHGQDQHNLMTRAVSSDGPSRVLIRGDELSADGTVAIDWYYPSDSGRLLAYGLSQSGDEESVLYILDVTTGAHLDTKIPGTRFASLVWAPDEKSFIYTRYPLAGTRYWQEVSDDAKPYHRQIYSHILGTDYRQDLRIFGADIPRDDWPNVDAPSNASMLVISQHRGWSDSLVLARPWSAQPGTPWTVVADREGSREHPIPTDEYLFLFTNHDAPRGRVLRLGWDDLDVANATEVIPTDATRVMESVQVIGGRIVIQWLHQASSQLELFDFDGQPVRPVNLPTVGSVTGLGGERRSGDLLYGFSNYVTPPVVYRTGTGPHDESVTFNATAGAVNPDDFTVTLHRTTSKDGTSVSLFIVHRRDLEPDGQRPTVLYGYGGFNISLTPSYNRHIQPFLAAGGVYAVAHLRGGGEYGEAWHEAGMLGDKQNVFDDFAACADYLVSAGFTRPEKLAVMGGSNGGLLTGVATVQFPEKFRASVIRVPLLDMLRYHRFLVARLWIPEYGDPEAPEAFQWLRAYSPYHNVPEAFDGPSALIMAAESDTRVAPLHARKFAALLQAKTVSARPVLLRIETKAGHGAGKPTSKIVDEYLDIWRFLGQELGISWPAS
ncbi:MAG: prolyl oligopeptidase family serine peptidase [Myxococcota bacterium]